MSDNKENIDDFSERCKKYLSFYVPEFTKDSFISGGFFPRLYHNIPIRDIDVFVNTDSLYNSFIKEYIDNKAFIPIVARPKFWTFQNKDTGVFVDLISFHEPKDIMYVHNFDFTICQGYFVNAFYGTWYSKTSSYRFQDIRDKRLRFSGKSMCGKSSNILTRLKKYLDLGFKIEDDELTKIYKYLGSAESKDILKVDYE